MKYYEIRIDGYTLFDEIGSLEEAMQIHNDLILRKEIYDCFECKKEIETFEVTDEGKNSIRHTKELKALC